MEEKERYLGGVTSPYLGKGLHGCAMHATTRRIIGSKKDFLTGKIIGTLVPEPRAGWFIHPLSNPTKKEFDEAFKEILKSKLFELKKEEIEHIQLKRPGRVRWGYIKFLPKSGEEIEVHIEAYPSERKLFEIVGELMQAFLPGAVQLEN